jgi:hypothetical protein
LPKQGKKPGKYSVEKNLNIDLITIPRLLDKIVEWALTYSVKNDFLFLKGEFRDWNPYSLSVSA